MTFKNRFQSASELAFYILISTSSAVAEDPKIGRLPDGRAFRTDAQGNQLVDYIAELELSIESLERQVRGLEAETQRKQEIIESLQAGKGKVVPVMEKDLLDNKTPSLTQNALALSGKPMAEKVASNQSCEPYIKQAKNCAQLLEDQKLDIEVNAERHSRELQDSKGEIARLENALKQKSDEQSITMARLASLEEELETAHDSVRAESDSSKIAVIHRVPPETIVDQQPPFKAKASAGITSNNFERSRSQAVEALQDKMVRDLNSLEALVASRNTMYQRYVRIASSPEIQPESINMTRRKIDSFRQGIQSAQKVHQLSEIRLGINSLRGEIQQDIAIMRRVVR